MRVKWSRSRGHSSGHLDVSHTHKFLQVFVSLALLQCSGVGMAIWELQLPLPRGQLEGKRKRTEVQLKEVEKVPAKVLWELPSFKESGLPPAPFQYPILTADGALCFVLVDQSILPQREAMEDSE